MGTDPHLPDCFKKLKRSGQLELNIVSLDLCASSRLKAILTDECNAPPRNAPGPEVRSRRRESDKR